MPKKLVGGVGLFGSIDVGVLDVVGNPVVVGGGAKAGFGGTLDGSVSVLAGLIPKLNDKDGAEGDGWDAETPVAVGADFSAGFWFPKPVNLVGNAKVGVLGVGADTDTGADVCELSLDGGCEVVATSF